jgi:nanoRNase/pAp phosphatase (c-di-AMP/oligoRNAs hydrolase)
LISDQPERFRALSTSSLAGQTVHLWLADGEVAPSWSEELRGDPVDPATYAPLAGREAIVVVDLGNDAEAHAVAEVVSRALPLAAVLMIGRQHGGRREPTQNGIMWIDEGELLTEAIDNMLRRVAVRKRVQGLTRALNGAGHCAFLVQNDPDPDAIASALALRKTLGFRPAVSPIVTCGQVTRPENLRLLEELKVTVRHVSAEQLRELEPLVLVDVQPPYFGDLLPEVAAVIDHHPTSGSYRARYRDVRTMYGASATMTAQYLLSSGDNGVSRPLATALLYGITTDTRGLSRSASDEDLEMFAYLFPRADQAMLRRIQHPSYGPLALKRFGQALQRARVRDGLAYVHLGRLPRDQEHIVAQLAEFCLGMRGARVAVVSGIFGRNLVMSTRALSPRAELGEALRALFNDYGSAGGHPMMAKAVIALSDWKQAHPFTTERGLERTILQALQSALAEHARADGGEGL